MKEGSAAQQEEGTISASVDMEKGELRLLENKWLAMDESIQTETAEKKWDNTCREFLFPALQQRQNAVEAPP